MVGSMPRTAFSSSLINGGRLAIDLPRVLVAIGRELSPVLRVGLARRAVGLRGLAHGWRAFRGQFDIGETLLFGIGERFDGKALDGEQAASEECDERVSWLWWI